MKTKYFFTVSMDVAADKEDLFNEVYETEHVPYLTAVPGVLGATRSTVEPLRMMLAVPVVTWPFRPLKRPVAVS